MTEEQKKKTVTYASPAAIPWGIRPSSESPRPKKQPDENEEKDIFFESAVETDAKFIVAYLQSQGIHVEIDHSFIRMVWRVWVPQSELAYIEHPARGFSADWAKRHTFVRRSEGPETLSLAEILFGSFFLAPFFLVGLGFLLTRTFIGLVLGVVSLSPIFLSVGYGLAYRRAKRRDKPVFPWQCVRCDEQLRAAKGQCTGCKREILRGIS